MTCPFWEPPAPDDSYPEGQCRIGPDFVDRLPTDWCGQHPGIVPAVEAEKRKRAEEELARLEIKYGGRGSGGEYYSKEQPDGLDSISLWTEGDEFWTPEELRAIADHKEALTPDR